VVMAFKKVNSRRHIGLQQLSSLASIGRTLLGPTKSCKFIIDESTHESVLTCSVVRLLENLDASSAVGQLLHETIQAQHKEYKTGMTTLLFLLGAWSNAVLDCLQQNIPLSVIVSVMSEGLDSCIAKVQCLQISIHNLYQRPDSVRIEGNDKTSIDSEHSLSELVGNEMPESHLITSSYSKKMRLTHSRHFNTLGKSHCLPNQPNLFQGHFTGPATDSYECSNLGQLAMSLSHGNRSSMKLVQDIIRCQQQSADKVSDSHTGYIQFNISEVVTCCLSGLSDSYSCACQGYVTLISPEKAAVTKQLQDKPLQIILVDGDLTERYRHLGFNRSSNVRMVSEGVSIPENSSISWINCMLDILIQSKVNLILVRGNVCENVMEKCILNKMLIINPVTPNVLQAFGEVTGAEPVTYLTQMNEHCVGNGAFVNLWRTGELTTVEVGNEVPISIKAPGIPLVTAVLSSTIAAKMQAVEDQFWTCAYRLHHALSDQAVFLGGGAVELLCLSHLQKLEKQSLKSLGEFHNASPWLAGSLARYEPTVLKALASGWAQYLSTVMCNTANCASAFEASTSIQHHLNRAAVCYSSLAYILKEFSKGDQDIAGTDHVSKPGEVLKTYDNVTAKVEAWRRALDLVLLVLQTDAEIITDPKRKQLLNSQESSEFMFL
uniref:Bardet-Biedl syndrome 12 n=1 Tax=Sphenodon punctatus TaxID=8508 RepID=A0A8D0GTQ5_SPHPU